MNNISRAQVKTVTRRPHGHTTSDERHYNTITTQTVETPTAAAPTVAERIQIAGNAESRVQSNCHHVVLGLFGS